MTPIATYQFRKQTPEKMRNFSFFFLKSHCWQDIYLSVNVEEMTFRSVDEYCNVSQDLIECQLFQVFQWRWAVSTNWDFFSFLFQTKNLRCWTVISEVAHICGKHSSIEFRWQIGHQTTFDPFSGEVPRIIQIEEERAVFVEINHIGCVVLWEVIWLPVAG